MGTIRPFRNKTPFYINDLDWMVRDAVSSEPVSALFSLFYLLFFGFSQTTGVSRRIRDCKQRNTETIQTDRSCIVYRQ